MISGVKDIYYNVSDTDRAVKFYRDVLGMKVNNEDQYWTSLGCGDVEIGLHWTEGDPGTCERWFRRISGF